MSKPQDKRKFACLDHFRCDGYLRLPSHGMAGVPSEPPPTPPPAPLPNWLVIEALRASIRPGRWCT